VSNLPKLREGASEKLARAVGGRPAANAAEATAQALGFLRASFGARFSVDATAGRAWAVVLEDFLPEEIAQAAFAALSERSADGRVWPPTLGDLLDLCERASATRRRAAAAANAASAPKALPQGVDPDALPKLAAGVLQRLRRPTEGGAA